MSISEWQKQKIVLFLERLSSFQHHQWFCACMAVLFSLLLFFLTYLWHTIRFYLNQVKNLSKCWISSTWSTVSFFWYQTSDRTWLNSSELWDVWDEMWELWQSRSDTRKIWELYLWQMEKKSFEFVVRLKAPECKTQSRESMQYVFRWLCRYLPHSVAILSISTSYNKKTLPKWSK